MAQDARPVFQSFKAVVIGPHVMAGLTTGTRTVVADPSTIDSRIAPLSSAGVLPILCTTVQKHMKLNDLC